MSSWQQLLIEEKLNWTVESDEKLFNHLEAFAERIIETCGKVRTDLNALLQKTTAATTQVHCAFNSLSNLSSSQFVANALSEKPPEEPTEAPAELDLESPPTRMPSTTISDVRRKKIQTQEARDQAILTKHQLALQLGLAGLKVDALLEDRSHEDVSSINTIGSVFRGTVKNMPHIIGTPAFVSDKWIGLYNDDQDIKDIESMSREQLEVSHQSVTLSTSMPTSQPPVQTGIEPPVPPSTAQVPPPPPPMPMNTPPPPPPMPMNTPPPPPPMPMNNPPPPPKPMNTPPPPPPMPMNNPPPPPPPMPMPGRAPGVAPPNPPPVPAVKPGDSHVNFQKKLQLALSERKKVIDGVSSAGLSVKDTLRYESQVLGTPERVFKTVAETKKDEGPPKPKEEQSLAEKRSMLAKLYGGGNAPPLRRAPNPPVEKEQPKEKNELEYEEDLDSRFKKPVVVSKKLEGSILEEEEKPSEPQRKENRARADMFKFLEEEDEDVSEIIMKADYAKNMIKTPSNNDEIIKKKESTNIPPPVTSVKPPSDPLNNDMQLNKPTRKRGATRTNKFNFDEEEKGEEAAQQSKPTDFKPKSRPSLFADEEPEEDIQASNPPVREKRMSLFD